MCVCVCVLDNPSTFQRGPFRRCITEETSVAHWLFEIPGVEFAVHAGRKSSLTPRSENTHFIPNNIALTGCEVKGSGKIFTWDMFFTLEIENLQCEEHNFKISARILRNNFSFNPLSVCL